MIAILFCVLCSTGVLVLFKLIPKLEAETSHAILLSYAVSAAAGYLVLPTVLHKIAVQWVIVAAFEGAAFYGVFHLMAHSTRLSGIVFTSLASKMSVVIPISVGLLFLGDAGNIFVVSGVLLGLTSVVLSVSGSFDVVNWRWPVLVFLGTGAIDASFKLFQVWGLPESDFAGFIVCVFGFAFLTGLVLYVLFARTSIAGGSVLAGFTLGLLNLGTVHFLMQALAISWLDSTLVYALNSFGIVLMSTLVAVVLFSEKLSKKSAAGIIVAVASIVSLYVSHGQ